MIVWNKKNGIPIDGEIYCHGWEFGDIQSVVNSSDKEVPDEFKFHAFDLVLDDSFHDRYSHMVLNLCHIPNCEVVVQCAFDSVDEIKVWFESLLELGYEGVILRIPDSPYKFGRSTAKEGFMLKLKPYESFDTEVLEIVERMENLNESQTNELGQSFKRNTKGDKQGTGMASSFYTELDGVRGKVVFGGDEAARREIWENRESYIGKTAEWKGMLVGSKDFPRHPTFLNWRGDK
ncbi:MAG: hypothetical protein D4S01_06000 [Dehalococcoidia bacterium]|nr:MAG: hypothetical protein D4S01_06000 [Dehalococcoidia bacterium]